MTATAAFWLGLGIGTVLGPILLLFIVWLMYTIGNSRQ
jgi:hypothetical protein